VGHFTSADPENFKSGLFFATSHGKSPCDGIVGTEKIHCYGKPPAAIGESDIEYQ